MPPGISQIRTQRGKAAGRYTPLGDFVLKGGAYRPTVAIIAWSPPAGLSLIVNEAKYPISPTGFNQCTPTARCNAIIAFERPTHYRGDQPADQQVCSFK
jgi:hypothetical protein